MAKLLLLLSLPALLLAGPALRLQDDMPVLTQEAIDMINAKATWKASLDWVGDMTIGQARQKLGTLPTAKPHAYKSFSNLKPYLSVPSSFDSRTQWSGCIGSIRDEGQCGSNWAITAAGVLSDRFCISKNETVTLSPQWLVSCNTENHGCQGGYIQYAWEYMKSHGIPLDSCSPYTSDNGQSGSCDANCATFYTATDIEYYSNPYDIQAAILKSGPVQSAMTVYQDFMGYQSGIYMYQWGSPVSGDAVKIVGWGNEGGVSYWIAANSWGTDWGMSGFFEIGFGQCGIDSDAIAGAPNSSSVSNSDEKTSYWPCEADLEGRGRPEGYRDREEECTDRQRKRSRRKPKRQF